MNEEVLPKELTSNIARRGKWTVEEERYTEQIIEDFDQGVLDVPEGTTLRTYLSRVLNCDPMRITKKYTGNLCIGKRTFTPKPCVFDADFQYLGQCFSRLIELRQCWINKLLLTEQWNNRKLTQFRGGAKPPMDDLPTFVPSQMFASQSPFLFGNSGASAVGPMSVTGASVSPPNEEVSMTTTGTSDACATTVDEVECSGGFSEYKVFSALRPFVRDIVETELIIEWLKSCSSMLTASNASVMPESQMLDQLTASCSLSLASLYKVLLSGCVAEFKLLHSSVQAVFERLILACEPPRPTAAGMPSAFPNLTVHIPSAPFASSGVLSMAASMMPLPLSSGDLQQMKLETVSNDGQDTASEQSDDGVVQSSKRAKCEHSVTPTLGTPTHASSSGGEVELLTMPTAAVAPVQSSSSATPVTPTAASANLSLDDCVRTLKQKRTLQMMRGPISATAAQYQEQHHRALECSRANPLDVAAPSSAVAAASTAAPFLSAFDPQMMKQKLTSSLNQSMVKISRSVLDHSSLGFPSIGGHASSAAANHMMYVSPSNIESAAEALLGLISN